jgi:hypothetical protein
MIIAEQKKKENIAEYLLYMYQVEDMIRASEFDLDRIDKTIIAQFDVDYGTKREMREWYKGLIEMMEEEGIKKSGHMKFLREHAGQLHQLHLEKMKDPLNDEYKQAFEAARPQLEALRMRSGHGAGNDVEIALNGLYGLLILRIQGKEIHPETTEAFSKISAWIAHLAATEN